MFVEVGISKTESEFMKTWNHQQGGYIWFKTADSTKQMTVVTLDNLCYQVKIHDVIKKVVENKPLLDIMMNFSLIKSSVW